jgi:integrase
VLFLAHDLHADHAAGTVRRIIATLIALLDFAKDLRWIEANPARVPPPLGRDPHGLPPHAILDPAELLAVWAVQRRYSPLADVTLFLGLTGLRWGEFVALRPGDLLTAATGGPIAHVARSIVRARGEGPPTVKSTKTGADRLVPLAHLTADIAQTWANGKDLLTNGPDILGVQGILGHASPTTTLRYYGHLTGTEHLRAPMDHYEAPLTAGGQAPGGALGATRPSMTTRTKTPIMENPL